ncbi:hypothetical protein [Wenyingzhuangia sp. IMCC45467]
MKKTVIILLLIIGILSSCSLSKTTNTEIELCVNENIIESFNQANSFEYKGRIIHLTSSFDLFDSLKKVERTILTKYKLKESTKSNYRIINKKGVQKIAEEIVPFMKCLVETPGATIRYPWDLCFRVPLSKKMNFHGAELSSNLDNVMINGGFNNEIIESLIEKINYKNDTERNILLYCIYLNEYYNKKH